MLRYKISGFTLIELMVVIVIIGVLASLAIPRFSDASVKAKVAEAPRVIASYESAQLAAIAESGLTNVANLIFENPSNSKWFTYTGAGTGPATYKAEGKASLGATLSGKALTTTIDASGVITHTKDTEYDKYVKNF